jgi:hypothetical protein
MCKGTVVRETMYLLKQEVEYVTMSVLRGRTGENRKKKQMTG